MARITSSDHLTISVSNFQRSKRFYSSLFKFLGMRVMGDYGSAVGWKRGNTRFWIYQAEAKGRKRKHRIGDVGFHHYAFALRSRKDVDDLQRFLNKAGATIVDPAGEYYENYYAVYFLDPDGLKLEAMHYGKS